MVLRIGTMSETRRLDRSDRSSRITVGLCMYAVLNSHFFHDYLHVATWLKIARNLPKPHYCSDALRLKALFDSESRHREKSAPVSIFPHFLAPGISHQLSRLYRAKANAVGWQSLLRAWNSRKGKLFAAPQPAALATLLVIVSVIQGESFGPLKRRTMYGHLFHSTSNPCPCSVGPAGMLGQGHAKAHSSPSSLKRS